MARRDVIAEKLTKAFAPASVKVIDESHQHAGHAGHREGGETHFRVYIVAEAFHGKSRLQRHRMVNETLVAELKGGVHALAIHAAAPGTATSYSSEMSPTISSRMSLSVIRPITSPRRPRCALMSTRRRLAPQPARAAPRSSANTTRHNQANMCRHACTLGIEPRKLVG